MFPPNAKSLFEFGKSISLATFKPFRNHPFKTSLCLGGGGVPICGWSKGNRTVHKDQKSPS